jgi:hypothetical protein
VTGPTAFRWHRGPARRAAALTRIRRRTPARDIADFDGGQPLRVVGSPGASAGRLRSAGKGRQIARLRQGHLRLAAGEPPLAGGKARPAPKFERYELVTAGWDGRGAGMWSVSSTSTYVDKMSTQYSALVEVRVEGLARSG